MRRLGDPVSQADPQAVDSVLAVAVCAAIEVTIWLSSGVSTHDRTVTSIAAVLFAAPIAVRRVWAAAALLFSMAVVLVSTPFGGQLLSNDTAYIIPTLVLSYSVGERLDVLPSTIALTLSLALGWGWALLPGSSGDATAVFYVTMLIVPTWLTGHYVRRHRERTSSFNALATQAAADKAAQEEAAIAAERARIGSELQDIIAHSISAMVIQAGSARLLLRHDAERARSSILTVEETGRQALSDLRSLLGMLRKDDDPRALSPQPGLGQITALIGSLESLGLVCERHTVGTPIDLTPGVDLLAYRVIEAALQALAERHVRHSHVTVRYQPREIELEVRGDGAIPNLDGAFAPLIDRVALYHGELRMAPSRDAFTMRARLPLDPVAVA